MLLLYRTLETIYNVSGIPYSSNDNPIPSDQEEPRSQIDARSIRSRWDTTINYFINQATGFTPSMIANSKKTDKMIRF